MAADELGSWLAGAADLLVLHLDDVPEAVRRAAPRRLRLSALALTEPPAPRPWDALLLAVPDVRSLRGVASGLAGHGRATRIGVFLARPPAQLPVPTPRPEWPTLVRVLATSAAGFAFVGLEFERAHAAAPVLAEMARLGRRDAAPQWPTVGTLRGKPTWWLPAEAGGPVARAPRLLDQSVDFPPDIALVTPKVGGGVSAPEAHHVLTHPPAVVVRPADPAWSADHAYDGLDPLAPGPVDERVVNPVGFDKSVSGPPVELQLGRATGGVVLPGDGRIGDTEVAALRPLAGLELTWQGGSGPVAYARAVAHLAAAGVPLRSRGDVPDWATRLLPADLADRLRDAVDLTDVQGREEHSVRLRRAALRSFSVAVWRSRLAAREGRQASPGPTVSVLLPTKRPEMLPFALRQVARQQGLRELELVLVTHGFDADTAVLDRFRESAVGTRLVVVRAAAELPFGEVLNLGVARVSGDLVAKMDDDDWYGPDFLADLVLARQYTGADLIGCSSEFTYVEPLAVTSRRADPSEVFRPWVAGGTLLVERGLLRGVGGFRSTRRYVDAGLLQAVASVGGVTYRTHGLGYVLRRRSEGHTWDPGVDYFVDPARAPELWRGFRPSALLDPHPLDLPDDLDRTRA